LAEETHGTIVDSYRVDLGSKNQLRIPVWKLLFDDAHLSNVTNDKKSWFTQMEVLDLIYQMFFFTANNLGQQLTTSQFFSISLTAEVSAGGRGYSLCAV